MSTTPRHIPFGIMLQGPGSHMHAWKHPSNPADASVNLQFYIDIADRKSTRLNSSHSQISYAVFCLKKKNTSNSGSGGVRTTGRARAATPRATGHERRLRVPVAPGLPRRSRRLD